jgi:crotonobetainyl-CoA:carnitine CoA-transferase CaiB-like acyl-CoA transferase
VLLSGPLAGLRILDLSRVLAGPWCTQILADMGAEVIKIERPGEGDETRHWGPPWLNSQSHSGVRQSAYFLSCNRGKQSLAVDLDRPEGAALIRELSACSDILVENFRTGGLARKGLGYADIRAVKPDIIYCSITGFGQSGPRAQEAGYDYLIQGMGGLMSITGNADGEPGAGPQRVGVAISDLTTGLYSAIAILGALHHRERTGQGQHIDMALLDTQVGWLANQALNFLVSGSCPVRTGAQHPNLAPYQPFPTADGHVIIAVGNDGQFRRLCTEAGRPELADDSRFRTNPDRIANRQALSAILEERTRTRTSGDWIASLGKAAVPCGPINTIEQVFEDPQVVARGMRVELEHPLLGRIPGIATPIRYSETPLEYRQAPPLPGEHGAEILGRVLGKSAAEIDELKRLGVVAG